MLTSLLSLILSKKEKPQVVFILGGPGSGKGTMCEWLLKEYGTEFKHLSTGDLLRDEAKTDSAEAK